MCFDSHGDIIHISLYCWSILFNIFSTQEEILQSSSKFENKKLDNMEISKTRQFFNRRNLIALFPFIIIDLDHFHTLLMNEWNKLKTQNNLVEDKEESNRISRFLILEFLIGIKIKEKFFLPNFMLEERICILQIMMILQFNFHLI